VPSNPHAATASVVFRTGNILSESAAGTKSVPHQWRFSARSTSNGNAGERPTTPSYGSSHTSSSSQPKCTEPVGCAGCAALVPRIERIERALRTGLAPVLIGHAALEERSMNRFVGTMPQLSVLRCKLGAQLDMPLASHGERAGTDRGAHRTVQELLRVQTDCSLREMQLIVEHACRLLPDDIKCVPAFVPGTQIRPQTPKFTIIFSSYTALCRVLGIKCIAEVLDTVVRVRTQARTSIPVLTRVLGALFCKEDEPSSPLLIAVGHNLRQPEGRSTSIPVLFRPDTTWDCVDKIYEHKIEGRQMTAADILAECDLDAAPSQGSTGTTPASGVFSITWNTVSKLYSRSTFQHIEATAVHGTLHITVPFVLFRGSHHGTEVAQILTDDFVATAVSTQASGL
jgi:hypothetical protein